MSNNNIVLEVENLSKMYRLGEVGTGTIAHDLNRWWASVRGKEDPFSKVGQTNDRTQKAKKGEYVWALKDINFKVEQGEVLGVIGKNGAGKSTLLKLISQITAPTTGEIRVKGRIASLLEVGTGMHPELTGRENVFLNGAILGMTKAEIRAKFDDIMDFAGCSKYADTPVKRYSSGMKVRLGFAVAAFLEPEILIVDEVLAVGDAEFQKRAIGKMQEVSSGGGRTVLFVSHNMSSVSTLCQRTILLEQGGIKMNGSTEKIIEYYLNKGSNQYSKVDINDSLNLPISFKNISLYNKDGVNKNSFDIGEEIVLKISYSINEDIKGINLSLGIKNSEGSMVFRSWDIDENINLIGLRTKGNYLAEVTIPSMFLNKGLYYVYLASAYTGKSPIKIHQEILSFEIESLTYNMSNKSYRWGGSVIVPLEWNINKIK